MMDIDEETALQLAVINGHVLVKEGDVSQPYTVCQNCRYWMWAYDGFREAAIKPCTSEKHSHVIWLEYDNATNRRVIGSKTLRTLK